MSGARWKVCTPTGAAGAIAIVQIEAGSGAELDAALERLGLGALAPGEVRLRSLCGVDTGVVARWDERTLQLMPHAGAAVQRALIERLEKLGFAESAGGARYPEARDAMEEAMLRALARAQSPLAVDLLLNQARRWQERGIADPATATLDERDTERARMLGRLLEAPRVVALGPSNVGKSTLVNALAGRAVSIVADEPGTTRDHVGVTLDLAGLVVRYADTPGIRETRDAVEREAAAIALALARRADLVLLCGDRGAPPPDPAVLGIRAELVRVALRTDLGEPTWECDLRVCAPEGRGIAELVETVRERLVPRGAIEDPAPWAFWVGPAA